MRRLLCFFLGVLLLLSGCSAQPVMVEATVPPLPTPLAAPETPEAPADQDALLSAASFNDFTLSLLRSSSLASDTVVSGASAAALLCHLASYADEDALKTYTALLGWEPLERIELLDSVEAIQAQYAAGTSTSTLLTQHVAFGEGPTLAVDYLDAWASHSTAWMGFIDFADADSVKSLNEQVRHNVPSLHDDPFAVSEEVPNVVMADTVVSQVCWATGFDTANTEKKIFYLADGSTTAVMMMQARIPMLYYTDENVTMGILSASDGREVWFLIPGDASSLELLVQSLSVEVLSSWRAAAQEKDCNITLPIVEMSSSGFLDNAIRSLGGAGLYDTSLGSYPDMGEGIVLSSLFQACSFSFAEDGETVSSLVGGSHALSPDPALIVDFEAVQPFAALLVDTQDGGILLAAAITGADSMRVA